VYNKVMLLVVRQARTSLISDYTSSQWRNFVSTASVPVGKIMYGATTLPNPLFCCGSTE